MLETKNGEKQVLFPVLLIAPRSISCQLVQLASLLDVAS